MDFQYRELAASVLSHFIHQEMVEKVSGERFVPMKALIQCMLLWPPEVKQRSYFSLRSGIPREVLQRCVHWMAPFVGTSGRFGRATLKDFAAIKSEDRHNIQTHTDYMSMMVSGVIVCEDTDYMDV